MLEKPELVRVLGGLPMFEIDQLKAPVFAFKLLRIKVTLRPVMLQVKLAMFEIPEQFMADVLAGGVSSGGITKDN